MTDQAERIDRADTIEGQMIADYVSEGVPLTQACEALGMHRNTVYNWIAESTRFREMMEQARAVGYDRLADECLAIADETAFDTEMGKYGPKPNKEWMARSRLRVETRLKLLAKWHPTKYGEKIQLETKNANVQIPVSDDPVLAQRAYEELMKGS